MNEDEIAKIYKSVHSFDGNRSKQTSWYDYDYNDYFPSSSRIDRIQPVKNIATTINRSLVGVDVVERIKNLGVTVE